MSGLVFVVSGPGGVGKSTLVGELVKRDPELWLSRSWTTRERRPGETADAYQFVTRAEFEAHIDAGGFLEWTNFLGNYYGTPQPTPPADKDIVLEIEVDGASQVKQQNSNAVLIFILPPSREEQRQRLHVRGDDERKVDERLRKAEEEEPVGLALADHVIVNQTLDHTIIDMLEVIAQARRAASIKES
ncbi:MAG: guanylate kinase [Acidimicrobiaceae bacterium]|nr:guanylate kinase [Acidimicrobiaceae bacterium]